MVLKWRILTASILALASITSVPAAADFWDNCVLTAPQPVFKKGGFKLDKIKGKATETLVLGRAAVLHLEQRACEYVSRTYSFVLAAKPDNTNIVGWQYGKALELLSLLETANPKLKFADEKKALKAYVAIVQFANEGVEINVKPAHDQFYELISVASKQTEKDTTIIVTVWSGPY